MAVAVLDIDGTLVDTNYHHALAWFRALRAHDIVRPLWVIHRHIGMGGDQMVGALTDEDVERRLGDSIRAAESECYMGMIDEVEPMADARALLEQLRARGHTIVLASSAKPREVDHYLDLLDARELADDWTSAGEVSSTKPAPDLIQAALEKASARPDDAVMVGDSTWDVEAAARAGVGTIAVRTGGFGHDELERAGAVGIFESVSELLAGIERTPLR